jgi:hypothetical protein
VAKKQQRSVLDELKKASKGLVFTSETDAPLEPFLWKNPGKLTHEQLVELSDAEEGSDVEEMSLDDFFRAVPQEDRPQFDQLAKVLKQRLTGVKVYKVGDEAEREVYIAGQTPEGQWAGLKTTVVES